MTNPEIENSKKLSLSWMIWLFPIIALGISGWLLLDYMRQRGPTIKIYFEEASNIQADKTQVRFRGVAIGLVKKVRISTDGKDVVADIDLQSDAEPLAVVGSKFWVVVPKVNFSGVSGLNTLLEGPYIAIQPGKPESDAKYEFRGQLGSDTNEALENTTTYSLETPNAESVSAGDAVTFRGIIVGTVGKVTLTRTAQIAVIQINIQNKYVHLIRVNTAFWKKVGIQAKLGLFGSEIKMNSFESIMHGGIELFTPDGPGQIAKAHSKFPLQKSAPQVLTSGIQNCLFEVPGNVLKRIDQIHGRKTVEYASLLKFR